MLRRPDFRRLYGTRLSSQCADGIFQASLAGVVLFSPESAANPADIAGGFAALLLPYSFVGPFAGVLLDRWRRQRVLVWSNVIRCLLVGVVALEIATRVDGIAFYATALLVTSVNRFFLAAQSAAQPHVVEPERLVTGNALSTTSGSVAASLGRLSTTPTLPSGRWSSTYTTVRRKLGSPSSGEATNRTPGSTPASGRSAHIGVDPAVRRPSASHRLGPAGTVTGRRLWG